MSMASCLALYYERHSVELYYPLHLWHNPYKHKVFQHCKKFTHTSSARLAEETPNSRASTNKTSIFQQRGFQTGSKTSCETTEFPKANFFFVFLVWVVTTYAINYFLMPNVLQSLSFENRNYRKVWLGIRLLGLALLYR